MTLRLASIVLTLVMCTLAPRAVAQGVAPDTLIRRLQQQADLCNTLELGHLDLNTHTIGISHCHKQGLAGRLVPHLLPFQSNPRQDVVFEAFSHISYQWPGDMHLNTISLRSNNQQRKARYVMNDLFQVLLPIYATRRYKDDGSNKSYVLPFYGEGPRRYLYNYIDLPADLLTSAQSAGVGADTTRLCAIHFEPRHHHHTLFSGELLIDSAECQIIGMHCDGLADLAHFSGNIIFGPDANNAGRYLPLDSRIQIDYHYLKTRADNTYYTRFHFLDSTPLDSLDRHSLPLDLTPYYQDEAMKDLDFERLRPQLLPAHIDALINLPDTTTALRRHRHKHRIETFSETLVDGSRLGPDDNRLRVYGPLDPASLGYDKFNGFTLRERARWYYRYGNNSLLFMHGEIGYSFRLRELRWKLRSEWTYRPQTRNRLRIEVTRSNSTFSSKFINRVNEALQDRSSSISFDSLGIDYYRRHEVLLEHSHEVANGVMFYYGILATYRDPVTHGVRRANVQHRQELLDTHYADFAPFLRVEYTPHQRYWYNHGYKQYIASPAPTFDVEFSRALPHVLGAESNYGRTEFDMHQSVHIGRTRIFAYRFGFGKFFNQRGEYFINYRYFARSQYPESWEDDRIGGTFHLLDDPWYSASPSYLQTHFMYETPFALLHHIHPISPYVIKERLYHSLLVSPDKPLYQEIGYGINNNYFNLGFFVGFKDLRYFSTGVKFRIEIGDHL